MDWNLDTDKHTPFCIPEPVASSLQCIIGPFPVLTAEMIALQGYLGRYGRLLASETWAACFYNNWQYLAIGCTPECSLLSFIIACHAAWNLV